MGDELFICCELISKRGFETAHPHSVYDMSFMKGLKQVNIITLILYLTSLPIMQRKPTLYIEA